MTQQDAIASICELNALFEDGDGATCAYLLTFLLPRAACKKIRTAEYALRICADIVAYHFSERAGLGEVLSCCGADELLEQLHPASRASRATFAQNISR